MPRAYLVPTTDPPIPLHDGTPWPAGGAEVEVDHYVRRRLADGDLVHGDPPAEADADSPPAEAGDIEPDPVEAPTEPGARRRTRREV